MPKKWANGLAVYYEPQDLATCQSIVNAAGEALILNQSRWALNIPTDCRIYIMTSWWHFSFQSAPWLWKLMLAVSFPIWSWRARKVWPYAGGLTQRFGHRVAIGIKPPRLLEKSNRSFGLQMYVPEPDAMCRIQHFTCHELTHACTAHLKLPAWLNEGIAMVTVDAFMGRPTIRDDTIAVLHRPAPYQNPPNYARLSRMQPEVVLYYTLLGYWLVQYLEKLHPGFLKQKLSEKLPAKAYVREIASCLGMPLDRFWQEIPGLLTTHYGQKDLA